MADTTRNTMPRKSCTIVVAVLAEIGKFSINLQGCNFVRLMSILWRRERAEPLVAPTYADMGIPSSNTLVPRHAFEPRRVCRRPSRVARVLRKSGEANVGKSIVRFLSILVVYQAWRHFSGNVKPCQPVRRILTTINHNIGVPSAAQCSCNLPLQFKAAVHSPTELASIWIVMKQLAQARGGDCFHDVLAWASKMRTSRTWTSLFGSYPIWGDERIVTQLPIARSRRPFGTTRSSQRCGARIRHKGPRPRHRPAACRPCPGLQGAAAGGDSAPMLALAAARASFARSRPGSGSTQSR